MCAVFGFLDYKGKVSNAVLKKLIHYLSIASVFERSSLNFQIVFASGTVS